jgi:hypothetical protein
MMAQLARAEGKDPRCILCGALLHFQTRSKTCRHHRLEPARYAEVFWEEV